MLKSRRRIDYVLATLAVAAILLMAGMMTLQYVQLQAGEQTVSYGHTRGEWDIFQLQLEQLRLGTEFDAALLDRGQGDAMARLGMRYSIFISRYDILRDGFQPAAG